MYNMLDYVKAGVISSSCVRAWVLGMLTVACVTIIIVVFAAQYLTTATISHISISAVVYIIAEYITGYFVFIYFNQIITL